jgi:hypothetical protein
MPAFAPLERPEFEDELEAPAGLVGEEPGVVAAAVAATSADDTDSILLILEMRELASLVSEARSRLALEVVGNTSVFPATADEDVTKVTPAPDNTAVECSETVVAVATLACVEVIAFAVDVLYAPGFAW